MQEIRITGEKVVLRPMGYEDTDLIVKWRNNERVRGNFIYRETFTAKGHENWIKTMVATGRVVQFIICEKKDMRPVGSVYFRDIDRIKKEAEYGIFLGEDDAAGKGYGTETARLAVDYAFEKMGLKKWILSLFTFQTLSPFLVSPPKTPYPLPPPPAHQPTHSHFLALAFPYTGA